MSEKCSKIKLTPLDGNMRLCVDGEIIDAGETEFEICHNAFRFVLPQKEKVYQYAKWNFVLLHNASIVGVMNIVEI